MITAVKVWDPSRQRLKDMVFSSVTPAAPLTAAATVLTAANTCLRAVLSANRGAAAACVYWGTKQTQVVFRRKSDNNWLFLPLD